MVEDRSEIRLFKASTTPDDLVRGVLDALSLAASAYGRSLAEFLGGADMFIHGTTRAINAILTTEGHPDVLVLCEGGRIEPINFTAAYPEPYVPRRLTFEIPGRIDANRAGFAGG